MLLKTIANLPLFQGPIKGTPASRPILWLIGFFAFLNVYAIQAVLPLVKREFQTSSMAAGVVVGITLFAVALLSPFIGLISDRIGRKNVICFSLIALAFPTAFIPFCTNLYVLMVLRFFQGLAIPGIIVVTMAYIGEETPTINIGRTTAAYVSGTVMGGFCGRFITGHVADLTSEWRDGFMCIALLNFIGIFLVLKLLPSSCNFTPNANMRQGLAILRKHLKNPKLIAASAVGFCVLFSLVSSFTYVNFLLDHEPFNLSSGGLANIFVVYLIGVVITPLSGKLISKYGSQRTLICALFFSMSGICLTLIPSLSCVIAGLAICSSGIFICQSASIGFIAMNICEGRSLATGIYNLCYYSGGAFGSWASGVAYHFYQWPGAVASIVFVQLIAASIALLFWGEKSTAIMKQPVHHDHKAHL